MQRAACAAGAELVLGAHLGYLAFVVLGLLLVFEGRMLGWPWTRRPAWRWVHLAAIAGVCALQSLGWACPLTAAEDGLRACAGQPVYREGFLGDRFGASAAAIARAEYLLLALTAAGMLLAPPSRRSA